MITDHNLLVAIFKNDVGSLSHRHQRILLRMHQNNIRILYKPEPQLFITDWLCRQNHKTNRDEEIPDMCITISTIELCMYISDCMMAEGIRFAMLNYEHVGMQSELILHGWPMTKAEMQKDLRTYWLFQDKIAIIDSIAMKGQKKNNACSTKRQGIQTFAPEPHGNREDNTTTM